MKWNHGPGEKQQPTIVTNAICSFRSVQIFLALRICFSKTILNELFTCLWFVFLDGQSMIAAMYSIYESIIYSIYESSSVTLLLSYILLCLCFSNLISVNKLPWISLTAHGFADSPVSATGYEHGFHLNGDNLLTIVLFPNNCVWLYSAFGSNDSVSWVGHF